MAYKQRFYEWVGKKGKLFHGLPIFRFPLPKRTSMSKQCSDIYFNYEDNVLTMSHWFEIPTAMSSRESLNVYYKAMREIFKPERQLCVVENRIIKKGGVSVLCRVEYHAKVKECPSVDQMKACLETFESKYVPMSVTQLQEERYNEARDRFKQSEQFG